MDNIVRTICMILGYGFMGLIIIFIGLYAFVYIKTRDPGGIEVLAREKWEQYKAGKEKKSGE